MRLDLGLYSLLSTALLLSPAAATDILWYSSSYSCGSNTSAGTHWTIYGAAQRTCYYTGTASNSILFANIPGGAKGQLYTGSSSNRCTNYFGETGSSTWCFPFTAGVQSANWFYPSKKLVRKEENLEPTRYSVTYELPNQTSREIELSNADFESVLKLVEAKDYEALAKYPTFVNA